jgi:hypothetical protein
VREGRREKKKKKKLLKGITRIKGLHGLRNRIKLPSI